MFDPKPIDNFGGTAAGTAGASTLTVSAGMAAAFAAAVGTLANGDYVPMTLTQASTETSWEVAKLLSISGTTATLAAPLANTWAAGSKFECRPRADIFTPVLKALWRASGVLADGSAVIVALAGRAVASSVYRVAANPTSGDTVTVESGTSATGPWAAWPNGPVTGPASGLSYPNAAAPVTHMRITRSAGASATSRYYIDEISN